LCELNVDILWTRTTYLCATAYPCFIKVSSFRFQVQSCYTSHFSAFRLFTFQ